MNAPRLYGQSPVMVQLRRRVEQVAATPLPVLILGETGTGKEEVARSIHFGSTRSDKPFVPVDCASISSTLIEAELFGVERGAFTGANQARRGLVAAADGGTFFLDEVAELPLETQTRLLRLLQEGTYRPVGGDTQHSVDIRVVAATWKDLGEAVKQGRFRRDLYHRLAVVELAIPPLRDRGDDIDVLTDRLLEDVCSRQGRDVPSLAPAVRAHLRGWSWPGNVRELVNTIEYLAAMTAGPRVQLSDLPPQLLRPRSLPAANALPPIRTDLPYIEARREWLDLFQELYVHALLREHDGNISAASRAAQMDRRSIQRILGRSRHEPSDS